MRAIKIRNTRGTILRTEFSAEPGYREIQARYSYTASCGHAVEAGDYIGWDPSARKTQCARCFGHVELKPIVTPSV